MQLQEKERRTQHSLYFIPLTGNGLHIACDEAERASQLAMPRKISEGSGHFERCAMTADPTPFYVAS
jgi:hypothetical protein